MTPIFQAAAIAALTLGTGAATVSFLSPDIPDMVVPEADWRAGNALDGRAFAVEANLSASDTPETDTLLFRDGMFQSVDCEKYCAFGWTPYQTWTEGETVHFTVTTQCPTAPHTVVWHGRVTGDDLTVEMSWTTRRWYWTHQITGTGGGQAVSLTQGTVSG
ncbi:MAG: hypothetical protein AAFX59_13320 [Pseudomonadota bacterium]